MPRPALGRSFAHPQDRLLLGRVGALAVDRLAPQEHRAVGGKRLDVVEPARDEESLGRDRHAGEDRVLRALGVRRKDARLRRVAVVEAPRRAEVLLAEAVVERCSGVPFGIGECVRRGAEGDQRCAAVKRLEELTARAVIESLEAHVGDEDVGVPQRVRPGEVGLGVDLRCRVRTTAGCAIGGKMQALRHSERLTDEFREKRHGDLAAVLVVGGDERDRGLDRLPAVDEVGLECRNRARGEDPRTVALERQSVRTLPPAAVADRSRGARREPVGARHDGGLRADREPLTALHAVDAHAMPDARAGVWPGLLLDGQDGDIHHERLLPEQRLGRGGLLRE